VFELIGFIVFGLVVGVLARLIVPGKQRLGVGGTLLAGVAGSIIGGVIASAIGEGDLFELNFIGTVIAVVSAALLIALIAGPRTRSGRRRRRSTLAPRRRARSWR
jgi:uncharacterized membrane protein YeaQ/YmgE (transglycosylase-associated protein family)